LRQVQRPERIDVLAGDAQGLATRREDADARTSFEQTSGKSPDFIDQLLAVVEHEQEILRAAELSDAVLERQARASGSFYRCGHALGKGVAVRSNRELAEPHPVSELWQPLAGDL